MSEPTSVNVECTYLGEFVERGEPPATEVARRSEIVLPTVVATYNERGTPGLPALEFTVLLKDGRTVAVRGHDLRLFPLSETAEPDSYGVMSRTPAGEVLVAVFKTSEVVGIFHGEIRPDRKIA